jgi:hypothetical protein
VPIDYTKASPELLDAIPRSTRSKTPVLDRIAEIRAEAEVIGQFLEWLQGERRVVLAEWLDCGELARAPVTEVRLLAAYFGIDEAGAERERRALLTSIRQPARKP